MEKRRKRGEEREESEKCKRWERGDWNGGEKEVGEEIILGEKRGRDRKVRVEWRRGSETEAKDKGGER